MIDLLVIVSMSKLIIVSLIYMKFSVWCDSSMVSISGFVNLMVIVMLIGSCCSDR